MKNLPDLKIPELSLILPCYNEKDNLKPVVESAFKILKDRFAWFSIRKILAMALLYGADLKRQNIAGSSLLMQTSNLTSLR